MFVAVVVNQDPLKSGREYGDLSCFVDTSKDVAIAKAMAAKAKWEGVHHDDLTTGARSFHIYRVLVGELTQEASVPIVVADIGAVVTGKVVA